MRLFDNLRQRYTNMGSELLRNQKYIPLNIILHGFKSLNLSFQLLIV